MRSLTREDAAFLAALGEEMRTQDTVGQADPRFWVVRQAGFEPCWDEQADYFALIDKDGDEAGRLYYHEEDVGKLTCVPVRKVMRNSDDTFFLTSREAREHIKANRHHYNADAHPYAMTAWRSPQVEKLWELLQEVDWSELGGDEDV